eukprot:5628142-Amphidinium_carterae.1
MATLAQNTQRLTRFAYTARLRIHGSIFGRVQLLLPRSALLLLSAPFATEVPWSTPPAVRTARAQQKFGTYADLPSFATLLNSLRHHTTPRHPCLTAEIFQTLSSLEVGSSGSQTCQVPVLTVHRFEVEASGTPAGPECISESL